MAEHFVIQCECGTLWSLDYDPTPEPCVGEVWRIGIQEEEGGLIDWGVWVDQDGNQVEVS